jgi:hypothetical protein
VKRPQANTRAPSNLLALLWAVLIVHSFYYEGGETGIYRCELRKIEAVLLVA